MTERLLPDEYFMARAIQLARRGLYTTDPNPRVGCVLVKNGQLIAEGWHRKAGEPHAERIALAKAGEQARGATAYVSLEPCSHHGRTPPCSDALIDAGVARVVAAMKDPNPLVSGAGLARLAAAGIEVSSGILEPAAAALNPGFLKRMSTGLPYVRCKLAMSLDGRTAMASGESKWITGAAARQDVQRLRARSSAILTGIGTVLADDPAMNVRLEAHQLEGMVSGETVRQPMRVVLDTHGRFPLDARMLALSGETRVLVGDQVSAARKTALTAAGASVEVVPRSGNRLSPGAALEALGRMGCNEVMVESGPTLAGAMLQAGLIDELIVYQAPVLMGDAARGLVTLPGIERMADRIQLELLDAIQVGDDLRLTYRPTVMQGE